MKCRNKQIDVDGTISNNITGNFKKYKLHCIITNDGIGKTLSINDGINQFTIPFEPIEKYLK